MFISILKSFESVPGGRSTVEHWSSIREVLDFITNTATTEYDVNVLIIKL